MTASALSPTPASAPSPVFRPPTAVVDASTRWPVLLMATASVKWLVLSLLAGAISFLKLHATGFLAGIPALTYGRLVAFQDSVFIYGFASQAAMAIGLWLICRLGATTLIGRGPVVIAALFWNFGVLTGALGILAGDLSPFAHFQFPHGALVVLFLAFCLYGICALLTFASRTERALYPSLWFVFAGIVFFPWILVSASMTLWSPVVRGSTLPVIAAWAGNNLVTLWLGSIALGAIYYFIPKASGKSLHSYGLAVFAFWVYVIFGQSVGMHATAAFPSWITTLSEFCTILLVLPAFANWLNWRSTLNGGKNSDDVALKFTKWSSTLYLFGSIIAAIAAYRPANLFLEFTFFQAGLSSLVLLGFITLSFFGAFAYILPRATDTESAGACRTHYTLSLAGTLLVIISLLLAGLIQAGKAADLNADYVSVVRSGIMPAGLAIIGFLLLLGGQISWLWNIKDAWCGCCCCSSDEGGRR